MNGYLCQLKGTNDDRRVNSPCLAFEYECKLLFLRMGRSLADNSVIFYVIVLFDHFLCCLLLFDGSYHKKHIAGSLRFDVAVFLYGEGCFIHSIYLSGALCIGRFRLPLFCGKTSGKVFFKSLDF